MAIIELTSLCVQSPTDCPSLQNVSLSVHRGETVALLSTDGSAHLLLCALAGVLPVQEGNAQIFGYDLKTEQKKIARLLSLATSEKTTSPMLTVKENLALLCRLHGKRKKEAADRACRLMASFDLLEKANVLAKDLPLGHMRRLCVAQALAYDPAVLLLHDVTADLTFHQKRELLDVLTAQKGKRAVVFSSSDPLVCTTLADRIAIFANGKLLAFDTKQALQAQTSAQTPHKACEILLGKEDLQ